MKIIWVYTACLSLSLILSNVLIDGNTKLIRKQYEQMSKVVEIQNKMLTMFTRELAQLAGAD